MPVTGIQAKQICKKFSARMAVNHVDLTVACGEIVGLLGVNGAGKTTTMRLLTGYYDSDGGEISHMGYDLRRDRNLAQSQFGYLPEGAPLPPDFRVIDYLRGMAFLRGMGRKAAGDAIDRVISDCDLKPVIDDRIEKLSKGFKRRIAMAQCLIHDPKILILDEPTDGLDPNQKHDMRKMLRQWSKSRAILISTHNLDEVESLCHRISVIHDGRIIASADPKTVVKTQSLGEYFRKLTSGASHAA